MDSPPSKMPRLGQDPRLSHEEPGKWKNGKSLGIKRFEYVEFEPVTRIEEGSFPNMVEFSLASNRPWFFGPNTFFVVKGKFQALNEKGEGTAKTTAWENLSTTETLQKYTIVPNWWEMLIKSFKVYHDHAENKTSNIPDHIQPFLNQFEYGCMEENAKAKLGKDKCHPVFSNYTTKYWGEFLSTADNAITKGKKDEWREDYGKTIINTNGEFQFTWIPPNTWPFWQGTKFPADEYASNPLPMHKSGRPWTIQILFNKQDEKGEKFFKKSAAENPPLRFVLTDIKLVVEEADISTALDKAMWGRKGTLHKFPGLTAFLTTEAIPSGLLTHRTRFQGIDFPEGIFIFAIHKSVVGGNFSYHTWSGKRTWANTNISEVQVTFNGKDFFQREPHLGQFENPKMDYIRSQEYARCPPFGFPLDPKYFTPERIAKAGHDQAYPHAYINLKKPADRQRVIPLLDDGSAINTKGNLDINIKFNSDGAAANSTYLVFVYWTDVAQVMEFLPNGEMSFSNPYLFK